MSIPNGPNNVVMPGLVPGIHVSRARHRIDVDGRDKPGHDENFGLTFYFFAFRFLAVFFAVFFFDAFFGTFLPSARASERPIAIACLRLFTFLPERPLFNVPALRFFITRSTSDDAFLEYFRAMIFLPVFGTNLCVG
jgi:hypothetical protein